ncbi:MAG: type IV toxin-antitoxin system AbiEi family antitoxin domain-containing protein [Mycobacteriales bacterium]
MATLMDTRLALRSLPVTFSYTQAQEVGLAGRPLARALEEGAVEQLSRGLYRQRGVEDGVDLDLVEIAHRAPSATLCLTSALAHWELTDAIPALIEVALPREVRQPQVATPVRWHAFDRATFTIGRGQLVVDTETNIGLYSAERSIVDAFRLSWHQGEQLGIEALKQWLNQPGHHPAALMEIAAALPRTKPRLEQVLRILQ